LDPREAEVREAAAALIANTAVWALRLVAGLLVNSLALVAEAWHSMSDNATSIIVYLGGRLGAKPPDSEHPYGHGKIADLATVLLSLALMAIAAAILWEAVDRFRSGYSVALEYAGVALVVVAVTGLVKEVLARYALKLYKQSGSTLCLADAWHHRVDALTGFAVLASLAGFTLLGTNFLDLLAALTITALLVYESVEIFAESAKVVIDTTPKSVAKEAERIALSTPGVETVHDIRVRSYGGRVYIDMKLHVNPEASVAEAHEIAHRVEEKIKEKLKSVAEVLVHVEPSSEHGE